MPLLSIESWWNALSSTQQIFWGIALISSPLFLFFFVLNLIGIDFSGDADVDAGGIDGIDLHTDTDLGDHGSHGLDHVDDPSFSFFTIRTLIAFATFFGWTGVMALHEGASGLLAFILSFVSGALAMTVVAYLFYMFAHLAQEKNLDIRESLDQLGTVYIPITAKRKGMGMVHVQYGGGLREVDAVTDDDQAISTGTKVRVVDVLEGQVLLVTSAK
jgi:membrane protein implicated in regulation of membrane protease activity